MNISNPAEGRIDREPELAGLGGGQAGVREKSQKPSETTTDGTLDGFWDFSLTR